MSQEITYWLGAQEVRRELPGANAELMPGLRWGHHWDFFTPAYWLSQFWMAELEVVSRAPHGARGNLAEEVTFCMLGGYGITAELAKAAFDSCCDAGLVARLESSPEEWERSLRQPLNIGNRQYLYRYPRQKARFLSAAMTFLGRHQLESLRGRKLRDALLEIKGVGLKTASWVARNLHDADDVAILDVHLIRAGRLCGLFAEGQKVERSYLAMEVCFLQFCRALGVRPAVLDCLIWDQMRACGKLALEAEARTFGKTPYSRTRDVPVGQQRLSASVSSLDAP